MTLPRLIFGGMAALAFADGAIVQGVLLLALVIVLCVIRPASEYASWR